MASFENKFSAVIEMKNYNIKTCFVSLKGPKAGVNKTSIDSIIFMLIFGENCQKNDDIWAFSVWLRTELVLIKWILIVFEAFLYKSTLSLYIV